MGGDDRRRTRLRVISWLGILLSLLFAWLAVRGIDVGELRSSLRRQNYLLLLPAGAVLALAVALRAWRWRLLFEADARPSFAHAANALLVGYLFNTILPARAGELARVHVLGRRTGVSRANVLATVVLERSFDLVVLVALLALAGPFLPDVTWLWTAVALGCGLGVALVASALAVRRWGAGATGLLLRPLGWLPGVGAARAQRIADNAARGLSTLHSPRLLALPLAVTAASWLALALSTWILLLGTDLELGFGAALLVAVSTNLVLVVPSSPAALGAFEAAVVLALAAYGVEREDALSFALVLHALNALPYIPIGYWALALHTRSVRRRDY